MLLSLPCRAAGAAEDLFETDALDRAVPASAAEALGGLTVDGASLEGGLEKLWAYLQPQLHTLLAQALHPIAAITAVSLLCAAARTFLPEREGFDCIRFAGCTAVAALALSDLGAVFPMGVETLRELEDFSHALLPTLTAAAAAAGAPTSAGAKYAAAALFSDILLTAANSLVLPLICAGTAAACADAVLGGALEGPVRFVSWFVKTVMKALVLCFTGYLSLSGILAAGTDAAAVKVTRAAISTLLPVVGKTVADASEALVAGAGLIRNSIGIFGLLAVLGVTALPVLQLALRYLLYKAAAAVLSAAAGGSIGKLIGAVGTACGMVLGLVGAACAILFLSVFSLIQTVSG